MRSLILALFVAVPALAAEPFKSGDVVVTAMNVACGPHFSCGGFAVYIHHGGSESTTSLGPWLSPYPQPTGAATYSPALNRIVLSADSISGMTLETMDSDGLTTPLLALPARNRVTALAGIGDEIFAVLLLPTYEFELWRIAAISGAVTDRIALPILPAIPPSFRTVPSIDLAGDRCTLAYVVRGEAVHRYDLCAWRPLEDLPTRSAAAAHFIPGGKLLVLEQAQLGVSAIGRLAIYDRNGQLVSAKDLPGAYGDLTGSIAVGPAGTTAWMMPGTVIDLAGDALTTRAWPQVGDHVSIAGEWRAAEQSPGRGRAARH